MYIKCNVRIQYILYVEYVAAILQQCGISPVALFKGPTLCEVHSINVF